MRKTLTLSLLLALLSVVGCGQKGDLYHTENVPPPEMEDKASK